MVFWQKPARFSDLSSSGYFYRVFLVAVNRKTFFMFKDCLNSSNELNFRTLYKGLVLDLSCGEDYEYILVREQVTSHVISPSTLF